MGRRKKPRCGIFESGNPNLADELREWRRGQAAKDRETGAEVTILTGDDAQWHKTNDELERESGALDA